MRSFYGDRLRAGGAVLAPMAGYSDAPFRKLALEQGAAWTVSEMMSAQGVLEDAARGRVGRSLELGQPYPGEQNLVLQLFGADPQVLAEAAVKVVELYGPAAVDLNMGCPVPKVRGRGGACLLQTPEVAYRIVSAMRAAVPDTVPLSAKIRLGWDRPQAREIALGLEAAGADLVTVHGRTSLQRYEGEADWEAIAEVAAALRIPVIGSGDVRSAEDYRRRLNLGVAGVMIGRGAVGQPWIFAEVRGRPAPDRSARVRLILEHARLNAQWYGEAHGLRQLRKVLAQYALHLDAGDPAELRARLTRVSSLADLEAALESRVPAAAGCAV
ncbi:nifR3 family TIM-barrel protein [Deinobacterium chartae]|uniref:tRNA-dihydrouridine synthase n=1 Tax=Deinobacterium chartae TaxID=521158 RepID=A0A841I1X7_9DEIO|nr:tRNA-dihydrouridine synthase family protein [Deinobacterium chartae]MBB6098328.1 nifR3 family TIM-barrel protein [Deinobacterium chartae]